jgi:hypothetical protein
MAYVERAIDITVRIGQGNFGEAGQEVVKLSGLRVIAKITKSTSYFDTAEVRIFGVRDSIMKKLAVTIGLDWMARNDNMIIEAGDAGTQLSQVFIGDIWDCYIDALGSPEVSLVIVSTQGYFAGLKPAPPTSYKGGTDVVTILNTLATHAGFSFENQGVQGVVLTDPYYPGTVSDQIKAVCEHANILYTVELINLIIWPKTGHRGGAIPEISAATGLVGYPSYNRIGPIITVLYAPGYRIGGLVNLDSLIMDGKQTTWRIYGLSYDLSSQVPGGPWFAQISCETPLGVQHLPPA